MSGEMKETREREDEGKEGEEKGAALALGPRQR